MNMETHCFTFTVFVLSFVVFVQSFYQHFGTHSKPGQCPLHISSIPSAVGCGCDEDCPDDHKCCEYSCGNVCLAPVYIRAECPHKPWKTGDCVQACADDHHCFFGKKCCFNGCGYECVAPIIVKPGRCTFPSFQCEKSCTDDGQCDGNQKCCLQMCGYACKDPF